MASTAAVEIRPVVGRRQRNAFVKLPARLYRGDPYFVPPLLIAEKERLDPRKNPFFDHGRVELFLAWRDGRPAGRIGAIDNGRHNEVHGDNLGFFGFFEAEDEAVARALLVAAQDWAREQGFDAIRGPANPSMNDSCGVQISAFDTVPYLMMPHNPPSYQGWIEGAGYAKAKDLFAYLFSIAENRGLNERAQRIEKRIYRSFASKPRIRPMSKASFEKDAATVRDLYIECWRDNWGFVPPTEREFQHAAKEMKQIIDWDLTTIMEIDGEPVAFSLALPDIHQVLHRMNGRLLPFGIFKLLMSKRYIDRSRLLLLGVKLQYRRKGLEIPLIAEAIRVADSRGWIGGECSWTLEDNDGINKGIRLVGGKHYKTYRMYQKALAPSVTDH